MLGGRTGPRYIARPFRTLQKSFKINQSNPAYHLGPVSPTNGDGSPFILVPTSSCGAAIGFERVISNLNLFFLLSGRRTWCRLAYWEESTRVGRQFPVSTSTVDVFATLEKGNGLCLSSLFEQNKRPTEATSRTREKIGQGKTTLLP